MRISDFYIITGLHPDKILQGNPKPNGLRFGFQGQFGLADSVPKLIFPNQSCILQTNAITEQILNARMGIINLLPITEYRQLRKALLLQDGTQQYDQQVFQTDIKVNNYASCCRGIKNYSFVGIGQYPRLSSFTSLLFIHILQIGDV